MSLSSRLLARMAKLPPADTYDVVVDKAVQIPMPDGVVLLADHYYPRQQPGCPTILVRSPYGRGSIFGMQYGRPFAERGFQVLIQSCRGTFGSEGTFDPFHDDRPDAVATVAWIKQQPWYRGVLATMGASYLGLTQWALASAGVPDVKAVAAQLSPHDFRRIAYAGGSLALDFMLSWSFTVSRQSDSPLAVIIDQMTAQRKVEPAYHHLPLKETDAMVTGSQVKFVQDWLSHNDPHDDWWRDKSYGEALIKLSAPTILMGGWYDPFLPQVVEQYEALHQAGHAPYLTIGPWTHGNLRWILVAMQESLAWFRAHLLGDRSQLRRSPVRLFVQGANEWRDYPQWPPAGHASQHWYLQAEGGLAQSRPAAAKADRFRYDSADPTPSVGGTSLTRNSGPTDQSSLEARPDVLIYTSAPLQEEMVAIGPIQAELYVRSSLEHTDFFARVCDVDASGKSINVSDGLLRLAPGAPQPSEDGSLHIVVELWPTAYSFQPGHRIRLQISSGAHPRYARNPGSGEALAEATTLRAADQTIYHDPEHPSALVLPFQTPS